ncbi:MAG TPA: DNA primase [Candidatus Paceibacterota bacterium]|nr:DNA primase [Candidatus Paceibacterota bacterium]
MADTVERIKEKLSIVDVVSPYVKLTKAGRYYKGLSPFNKEKTPSFFVNPERGTYYCFSSGQGGDAFTFIEKMEGLDFKGAMKLLAEKAGVPLEYVKGSDSSEKTDRLREAMARAEAFYARNLSEGSASYEYALSRGLSKETIRAWNLGFAPDAWRALLEELSGAGFTIPELLACGLIKEADGKPGTYYDRFRNRLMFPIRDGAGRVVAFTGRALDPNDQAKYLNSPETELFKKSQILFGMDRAKDAIRSRGFALLVEGQFDLILLHQIGFQNAIALSGTALSREHLALVKRYSDNLMLALDADRAGLAASAKNAHAALGAGMRVKAVRMPLGKDPADLAKDTPQDFARRVQEAEPIVEFFLSVLSGSERDPHRLVIAVERIVLPLIRAMKSPMEREHFIGVVARHLGSSPEAVRESLKASGATPEEAGEEVVGGQATKSSESSRDLLIRASIAAYPETPLAKRLSDEYARIIGAAVVDNDVPERALFEAGLLFGESPSETAGDDLLRAFERSVLTEKLVEATARLRRFESAKDDSGIKEALRECSEISAQLARLA